MQVTAFWSSDLADHLTLTYIVLCSLTTPFVTRSGGMEGVVWLQETIVWVPSAPLLIHVWADSIFDSIFWHPCHVNSEGVTYGTRLMQHYIWPRIILLIWHVLIEFVSFFSLLSACLAHLMVHSNNYAMLQVNASDLASMFRLILYIT